MVVAQRTLWVAVLLALVFLLAALATGSALYYRLTYLWVPLILFSWIWAKFSLVRVNVERRARGLRQEVGQVFEERFKICNEIRLARLWIQIKDNGDLPESNGSRVLTFIGGRQQRNYLSHTPLKKRGLYSLGPTELISGDPFGFFVCRRIVPNRAKLLVIPYMVDINSFLTPSGLLPGGKALHRKRLQVTPYAAGVREYAPGDSLNRIHWKSTARHSELMVKEFDQDPQSEVWIFIDAYQAVNHALPVPVEPQRYSSEYWFMRRKNEFSLPPDTCEYAVSIAASISRYFIHQGRAVGLASAGNVRTVLPAERGERQMNKILEALAFLNAKGEMPFLGLVESEIGNLQRGSTVILVTPSVKNDIYVILDDIMRRNMRPVVILLNAVTFGGPAGSHEVKNRLQNYRIPTIMVSCQDNLKTVLQSTQHSSHFPVAWWKD